MNDRVGSVTMAFLAIFAVMAARHQWLQSFITWLKVKPGPGIDPVAQQQLQTIQSEPGLGRGIIPVPGSLGGTPGGIGAPHG